MTGPGGAAVAKPAHMPPERRERRPVAMRGFVDRENGTTVDVRLLDLSYEGCGIECLVPLSEGESVKLTVMRRGIINARVRWAEEGKAGLVFDNDVAAQRRYRARRFQRCRLAAEVSMRRPGRINHRVHVFDISPEGCKVELAEIPDLQEQVLIKLDAIEWLEAEVCWLEGGRAGLRFARSIHPAVFDLLIERLKPS